MISKILLSPTLFTSIKRVILFLSQAVNTVLERKKKGYKEELLKNIEIVKIVSLSTTNKIKL